MTITDQTPSTAANMPVISCLEKLREQTRAHHSSMDGLLNILNSQFSLDDYKRLLGLFYGFYAALDPQLTVLSDNQARHKSPLLKQDLTTLGVEVSHLPLCQQLPDTSTAAHQMGCMYVIEGSTLGGQMISRHLETQMGITADNGGRFFNSYGSQVGPMWKTFCNELDAFTTAHPDAQDDVVAAACQTFETLGNWFRQMSSKQS